MNNTTLKVSHICVTSVTRSQIRSIALHNQPFSSYRPIATRALNYPQSDLQHYEVKDTLCSINLVPVGAKYQLVLFYGQRVSTCRPFVTSAANIPQAGLKVLHI